MGSCASSHTGDISDRMPYIPCELKQPIRNSGTLTCNSSCSKYPPIRDVESLKMMGTSGSLDKISDEFNKRKRHGLTSLHLACEQGDWQLVELLVQFGAVVDLPTMENNGKSTALILAASGGHHKCIELLLQAGADVNQTDIWGNSAIFKASCYNFLECVELLLQHGADPNSGNKWGALPLQYAARQGHHQMTELLTKAGADVTARGDMSTLQAIEGAIYRGHYQCVKGLLEEALPSYNQEDKKSLLQKLTIYCMKPDRGYLYVIKWDYVHIMRLLLNLGAVIDEEALIYLFPVYIYNDYSRCERALVETVVSSLAPRNRRHDTLCKLFMKFSRLKNNSVHLMNMLISAGYDVTICDIQVIQNDTMATLTIQDIQNIREKAKNPRSLSDLTRLTIRQCLHSSIKDKSEQLSLPRLLGDYIHQAPQTCTGIELITT